MGSPEAGVECGIAHIGGAKMIQLAGLNAAAFARTDAQHVRTGFGKRTARRGWHHDRLG